MNDIILFVLALFATVMWHYNLTQREKLLRKLDAIRSISSIYLNDSKHIQITKIIDDENN